MYIIKNVFCRINNRGLGAPSAIFERLKKIGGNGGGAVRPNRILKRGLNQWGRTKVDLMLAIMSKFPLKKEKTWLLCLGMIRTRIASQKLEKITSSTMEPIKTQRANPNKTRVLLGQIALKKV